MWKIYSWKIFPVRHFIGCAPHLRRPCQCLKSKKKPDLQNICLTSYCWAPSRFWSRLVSPPANAGEAKPFRSGYATNRYEISSSDIGEFVQLRNGTDILDEDKICVGLITLSTIHGPQLLWSPRVHFFCLRSLVLEETYSGGVSWYWPSRPRNSVPSLR